jgi:hypothetical protein
MRVSTLSIRENLTVLELFMKSCPVLAKYCFQWPGLISIEDIGIFQTIVVGHGSVLKEFVIWFSAPYYSRIIPVILSNCASLETLEISVDEDDDEDSSDDGEDADAIDDEDDIDDDIADFDENSKALQVFQELFTGPSRVLTSLPVIVASNLMTFRCCSTTLADLHFLAKQCRALTTIESTKKETAGCVVFMELLRDCPRIKVLQLPKVSVRHRRRAFLSDEFQFTTPLEELKLHMCDLTSLSTVLHNCPSMRELYYWAASGTVDPGVIPLLSASCPRLEEITIDYVRTITQTEIVSLVKALPKIQGLSILVPKAWERAQNDKAQQIWRICSAALKNTISSLNPSLYFEFQR